MYPASGIREAQKSSAGKGEKLRLNRRTVGRTIGWALLGAGCIVSSPNSTNSKSGPTKNAFFLLIFLFCDKTTSHQGERLLSSVPSRTPSGVAYCLVCKRTSSCQRISHETKICDYDQTWYFKISWCGLTPSTIASRLSGSSLPVLVVSTAGMLTLWRIFS